MPHSTRHCRKFLNLDVKTRTDVVKKHSICSNCLGYDHHASVCSSTNRCYKCGLKHHTLLHIESQNNYQPTKSLNTYQANASQSKQNVQSSNNEPQPHCSNTEPINYKTHLNQMQSQSLLATALVKVFKPNGTQLILRALIDPGSQATFITEDAAQILKLKKHKTHAIVKGLGNTETGTSKYEVNFKLFSVHDSDFSVDVRALVFNNLTTTLPTQKFDASNFNHVSNLLLADPTYNTPRKVDLLIGADVYSTIILDGVVKGSTGTPVAQLTELGWILTGNIHTQKIPITIQSHHTQLDVQLTKFWEIEENLDERKWTEDEIMCEKHFKDTCKRRLDGRYEVHLPFKNNKRPVLGNSKRAALARFLQIEKRMKADSNFKKLYVDCMTEYLTLGHMKEVKVEDELGPNYFYYLPHHAVLKESSTTTKLRVVFDGSCKSSNGLSLNECLMVGPRLQLDIIDLVARWRKFKIALVADISKMYRQIWVAQEDTPYQMILWRSSPNESIKCYCLNTVTFGTASAPFLAVRTLQRLAEDIEHNYPHVAKAIMDGFFVDDLIYGSDNEVEAIRLQKDIVSNLQAAGFPLRKWASNSQRVMEGIPENYREINLPLDLKSTDAIKTLGIQWHPSMDYFSFKINLPETSKLSKRSVLADIARLFDPLGLISPCIVKAKLILQQLWTRNLAWDTPLPQDIEKSWTDLRSTLPKISQIQIPRWIDYEISSEVELHGFSDASEKAYAAVIYIRVIQNNIEKIHLIASKTRVAPVKCISLPRLELCAALLLSKLIFRIIKAMQFENIKTYAWTDSMITLAWIKGSPTTRTTFVANRISEIQSLTNIESWYHVNTKQNPADFGSRGLTTEELINNEMWWDGPKFLRNFNPQDYSSKTTFETQQETKKESKINTKTLYNKNFATLLNFSCVAAYCVTTENEFLRRVSDLRRLIRIVAIWQRYISNLRSKLNSKMKLGLENNPLKIEELNVSRTTITKLVQNELFYEEIKALNESRAIPKGSGILNLNPFLDKNGILRVGGRLQNSYLPYSQRHPIILKDQHHFSKLIACDAHQRTLHGGQQLMMADIRNYYWITNLKRLVKFTIHKCVRCHRHDAIMQNQLMGSLPTERVIITRPFTNTGVDYAGPVEIKMWKGRCNKFSKGYIAVFVCLSTKALHLELVSDLTAATFIAAYRRFVARRGICNNLFSDCGTNFKGASNDLKRDSKFITSEWSSTVSKTLATLYTTWHFNPPLSPHFGGLWEAGVKSIKHHLKRTIGTAKLTFEEYSTLLTQIEGCLNSRPLCPMTSDPNDLNVLTPGHFLIGGPLNVLPDRNHTWSTSYLHLLQQRPKWLQQKPNINVGDIVIVKDDNLPPSLWLLARVIELHPGTDGLTRVATIKTQNSTFKRPITKLSPLPVTNPSNPNT
ncbi:uncharacterized protein LOC129942917 [Eupeodes corollae]|uniref:uncharacterized protein LOC129942917 n=1 Tax=Eupeodes corollae TaxID=290404 RepID=UPI002490CE3A|nr:uncharacterized protein LOC129942917 [Eupeodes corollae]